MLRNELDHRRVTHGDRQHIDQEGIIKKMKENQDAYIGMVGATEGENPTDFSNTLKDGEVFGTFMSRALARLVDAAVADLHALV